MKNRVVTLFLISLVGVFTDNAYVSAAPPINVNTEEQAVYSGLEGSVNSMKENLTIKPFDYNKTLSILDNIERFELDLNADKTGKIINSITARFFVTGEEYFFLEGESGLKLREGANFFLFEDGYFSFKERLSFYYQLKQTTNRDSTKNELFRAYMKLLFNKFSLELGKDNVNLGPGEYGLLLSSNVEPYPLVKIQTEDPLRFFGKWDFVFLQGWLREKRQDVSNPNILALRIVWKPLDFIELGGTKTAMFGGDGVEGYSLEDYPGLIASYEEHKKGVRNDPDGYGGYDISLYLPLNRLMPSVKIFKLYWQDSGTDITSWWTKDPDKKYKASLLGFAFLNRGTQSGIFLSTEKDIFRLEYASTFTRFYSHFVYNHEGYTYKGFSLGYPYGRNMRSIFLKHRHYFSDTFSIEYKLGAYEQPAYEDVDFKADEKMKRYYLTFLIDKRIANYILEGFFRVDKTENYDNDPLPTQFNIVEEDKTFYTYGFSLSWMF